MAAPNTPISDHQLTGIDPEAAHAVFPGAGGVLQHGNVAQGNIVGRDAITHVENVNYFEASKSASPSSRLYGLLKKLEHEVAENAVVETILEELTRYREPKTKATKTLEEKLLEGGRADLVPYAIEAKESFTKKLTKYGFYESAQDIHAMILAKIVNAFNHRIKPLILAKAKRNDIEAEIHTSIIEPIVTDLSIPPLRYYDTEAYGMLYFLTGNCHIEWA